MDVGQAYLNAALNNFQSIKETADRALTQLQAAHLHFAPSSESNSIAVIVKHLAGNMKSRWTDFLTTDGEKSDRRRDAEFEDRGLSDDELFAAWEFGWKTLFDSMRSLTPEDLLKTVYIRSEPHTVIQAIERQIYHASYHVGQIVYLAKQIRDADWKTLTIPRKRES